MITTANGAHKKEGRSRIAARRYLDLRLTVVFVVASVLGLSLPFHRDFPKMAVAFGVLVLGVVIGQVVLALRAPDSGASLAPRRRLWVRALVLAGLVTLLSGSGFLVMLRAPWTTQRLPALGAALCSLLMSCLAVLLLGRVGEGAQDPPGDAHPGPRRRLDPGRQKVGLLVTVVALWSSAAVIALSGLAERALETWVLLAWSIWLAGAGALAYGCDQATVSERAHETRRAGDWMIRGFLLLHFGEAVAFLPPVSWPTLGIWVVFEVTRAWRERRHIPIHTSSNEVAIREAQS